MMGRGILTNAIQAKAVEHFGREISTAELRFMPYVQYLALNSECITPAKISPEERNIFSDWRKLGWVTGGASEAVWMSHEFWVGVCEILYLGYVDYLREAQS